MTIPLGFGRHRLVLSLLHGPAAAPPPAPRGLPITLDATDAELARLPLAASAHQRRRDEWELSAHLLGLRRA